MRRTEQGGQSEVASIHTFFLLLRYQVLGDSGPEEGRLWKKNSCWEIRFKNCSSSASFCLNASRAPAVLPPLVLILCSEHIRSCPIPIKSPPSINPQRRLPGTAHQPARCLPDRRCQTGPAGTVPHSVQPSGQVSSLIDDYLAPGSFHSPWHFQQSKKKLLYLRPIDTYLKHFPRILVSISGTFSLNTAWKDVLKPKPLASTMPRPNSTMHSFRWHLESP